MTPREIEERAQAEYEAIRKPHEVAWADRDRPIQDAWRKYAERRIRAEERERRPSDRNAASPITES